MSAGGGDDQAVRWIIVETSGQVVEGQSDPNVNRDELHHIDAGCRTQPDLKRVLGLESFLDVCHLYFPQADRGKPKLPLLGKPVKCFALAP